MTTILYGMTEILLKELIVSNHIAKKTKLLGVNRITCLFSAKRSVLKNIYIFRKAIIFSGANNLSPTSGKLRYF